MTDVLSDDRLYERIDTGDAQSLRRLFSRHAPLTIALIAHLVGRSQAQDIVQETFLLLWSRRLHAPDEGSVQSWLVATAHDRAVEMVRRGGTPSRGSIAGALRTIVDAGAMPERWTDPHTRARQAVVLQALMALPADERAPIELMYFRGLSRRQIAERLGRAPLGALCPNRRRFAAARTRAPLLRGVRIDRRTRLDPLSRGSAPLDSRPATRSHA
jgi:RNA polymerase sigma factor, sigma-70 family